MKFSVYQHRLSALSARFNLMVFLVVGLLVVNLILAGLCWYALVHQRIEITPFFGSNGYSKNEVQVDSHYLSLMSENFIYSRLNVTPETVNANHQRLLAFVDASHYRDMLHHLHQEAQVITSKQVSSVFDIAAIRPNPSQLTTTVTGTLKRFVGYRALKEARMTYQLQFRYHLGQLTILQFNLIKEPLND